MNLLLCFNNNNVACVDEFVAVISQPFVVLIELTVACVSQNMASFLVSSLRVCTCGPPWYVLRIVSGSTT